MKRIDCRDGALHLRPMAAARAFQTEIPGWNALAPNHGFACGAVHELLFDASAGHPLPAFAAMLLARSAMQHAPATLSNRRAMVWCDPNGILYPPALSNEGIPLHRLYILRPRPADVTAAVAECLGCKGVAAVVAVLPPRLTRVEARRLQLAAERGGGAGVLIRTLQPGSSTDVYSAVTRWRVAPAPGQRRAQRWNVQLIHGHGGCVGQSFLLEQPRDRFTNPFFASPRADAAEEHPVHSPSALVDHPPVPPAA